jgi:hypothetical protein
VYALDVADGNVDTVVTTAGYKVSYFDGVDGVSDSLFVYSGADRVEGRRVSRVHAFWPKIGRDVVIGEGACPLLVADGRDVICYGRDLDSALTVSVLRYRLLGGSTPDTLARAGVASDGAAWQQGLVAPVRIDEWTIAYTGHRGAVEILDLRALTRRRLVEDGLVPMFWQQSDEVLVCWDELGGQWKTVSLDGREIRTTGALKGMLAFAQGPDTSQTLCIFSEAQPLTLWERRSLRVYSWTDGVVRTVRDRVPFVTGRMLWLP